MNTLNSPRLRSLFILCALVLTVAPCPVSAIVIGELTLSSKLGQPLSATVDTQPTMGENIQDICLAIVAIDESSNPLIQTVLSIRLNKDSHKIEINSKRPFNEPYAAFGLHIQCKGSTKSYFKALALLPDFESNPVSAPFVAPKTSFVSTVSPKVEAVTQPKRLSSQAKQIEDTPRAVEPAPNSQLKAKKHEVATFVKPPIPSIKSEFQLQLSAVELDISRGATMSAEDREFITAHRKMLDEDDQTAHLLAMKFQMKLMSEEIKLIRQKLASQEIANVAAKKAKSFVATDNWEVALKLLAGIVVVGLIGFAAWFYRKTRGSRLKPAKVEVATMPTMVKPMGESTMSIVHPGGSRQFEAIRAIQEGTDTQLLQFGGAESLNKEEQTVLEEAELYAVYGHSDKAIRILLEFLDKFPKSENAWMLLLSVYSSNEQISEFENTSRKFLTYNNNSPHWKTVQALGRTLDKDNELYRDESNEVGALWLPSNTTKQRLIGNILVELGYLSTQDMANCLGEFDPKQHGRFGNYLLMRRMINHTQLSEALLKQQSNDGTDAEANVVPEWRPEDTSPNMVDHHVFATLEHVQDKAFPLDLVIDDKPKFYDEAQLKQQSDDGNEVEANGADKWRSEDTVRNMLNHQAFASMEHVQDKAIPLDLVIDDEPKFHDEALPRQQLDKDNEVAEWRPEDTAPNVVDLHSISAPEDVQDKAFSLDIDIDHKPKLQESDDGKQAEVIQSSEWRPEDTAPNVVDLDSIAVVDNVQEKSFTLDFEIEAKPKFSDEESTDAEVTLEELAAEEVALSEVEDKAQPLAFHIDFEPTPTSNKTQDR